MPRVPVLDGPQVRTNAVQPVYQNPEQFTAGLRTLERVGGALENTSQVFDQIAMREAQRQAYDVESRIRADYLTFEQNVRRTRQGAAAKGLTDEVDQWWAKAAETYGKDLPPAARQLASRSLANARLQALAGAGSFENQQLDRALDESWAASKQTAISSALQNPAPEALASTVEELRRRNTEQAVRRGWTPEVLAAETLKDTTALHTGVLDAMLKQDTPDTKAARDYFSRYSSEINGAVHDNIERIIRASEKTTEAAAAAESVVGMPLDQALAKLREIKDPDVRARATQLAKQTAGDLAAAQQAREKQFSDQAWQLVGQGKRVPESLLGAMDGRERVQLQDFLQKRAEHAADRARALAKREEPKPVKTDPVALARLLDMEARDPEAFKKLRMESLAYTLGGSDLEQLAARQRRMMNPTEEREVVTTAQQIDAAFAQIKDADKRGQAKSRTFAELDAAQKLKGKPLTFDEKQRIIDRSLIQGEIEKPWYQPSPNRRFFEVPAAEREAFVRGTVPEKDRVEIEAVLKRRGVPVTPENVLDMFVRAKQ